MSDEEPEAKRIRLDNESGPQYSTFALRQMAKMGHVEGKGLGKHEQGRSEIVSQTKQLGRRGLGMNIEGFEASDEGWVFEEMSDSMKETPEWIPTCQLVIPTSDELSKWPVEAKKKLVIEDETNFCNEETLQSVLECKAVFDTLEGDEFLKARTRANPYETIKGGIFQNRAAMKMANIDSSFHFMFTEPLDSYPNGKKMVGPYDLLYFADICAAPGGFSEYVLWRRQSNMAKGFGLTLKGSDVNDFKLDDFFAAPVEFFEPHYGVNGARGDGDITNADNLTAFREFVLSETDNKGVHFVMGDGGFSVKNQENIQEILTKQLLLCQFLCALSILREGGNFVCKTFDLFTPFSVGLIYLLYRVFDRICIFKPVTSRPANSERYVVCERLRKGASAVHEYMFTLNCRLNDLKESRCDVLEVVPLAHLLSDHSFTSYMIESNEKIGKAQVKALTKLRIFVRNTALAEPNQAEVRKRCLEQWKVPDEARAAPPKLDAATTFQELWGKDADILWQSIPSAKLEVMSNVYDWCCNIVGGQRLILLGLGRNHVYTCQCDESGSRRNWSRMQELQQLELPRKTLLEIDLVKEYQGERKGQKHKHTVYIIDAMVIFGKDVKHKHYRDRLKLARKLANAVNKPTKPSIVTVRVHEVFKLTAIDKLFSRLCSRRVKNRTNPCLAYTVDDRFFCPKGLFFFKHLSGSWSEQLSRTSGRPYFFNCEQKVSLPEPPPAEALASYRECLMSRITWTWDEHNFNLHSDLVKSSNTSKSATKPDSINMSQISKEALMEHIRQHTAL
ncbi:cap-specific mRNA (nucleoside-2'-O-)-methyltransferase 1-like [Corticium candelabrum]|uniref:cap-specific mRNA (nucleoside-2'-O-)-methyltransferase 1-like n=1 Tax=Corticium candelabrum TaxID=121492 RepID=UPI002E26CF1F|nr:cap-specific mRNA (nucleoside-2'-O-)-methyltransferase 1-like [Corticium candelabrum]